MSNGFRPVQDISGGSYTGKVQTFGVAAGHSTLLSTGDLVCFLKRLRLGLLQLPMLGRMPILLLQQRVQLVVWLILI